MMVNMCHVGKYVQKLVYGAVHKVCHAPRGEGV